MWSCGCVSSWTATSSSTSSSKGSSGVTTWRASRFPFPSAPWIRGARTFRLEWTATGVRTPGPRASGMPSLPRASPSPRARWSALPRRRVAPRRPVSRPRGSPRTGNPGCLCGPSGFRPLRSGDAGGPRRRSLPRLCGLLHPRYVPALPLSPFLSSLRWLLVPPPQTPAIGFVRIDYRRSCVLDLGLLFLAHYHLDSETASGFGGPGAWPWAHLLGLKQGDALFSPGANLDGGSGDASARASADRLVRQVLMHQLHGDSALSRGGRRGRGRYRRAVDASVPVGPAGPPKLWLTHPPSLRLGSPRARRGHHPA